MRDIKEKAKEYDRLMEILWRDLEKAMNNPEAKANWLGPLAVQYYQEAKKFLLKYSPSLRPDQFDLLFLKKPIGDLSREELRKWRWNVARIRGCLRSFLKNKNK